jgi:hypothetical protein
VKVRGPSRSLWAAAALGVLAASPAGRADEPKRVELSVGDTLRLGGCGGRCDDVSVATITLDCNATLTALKPGRTLCSSDTGMNGGLRQVYEVVVTRR